MMIAVLADLGVILFLLWLVAEQDRRYYRREAERYRRLYYAKVRQIRQVLGDPEDA